MAEKNTSKKEKKYVTVNCNLLNVRISPDITSGIVRQAGKDEKMERLGSVLSGSWIKVPDGYVMAEFVS